jgi:hypothetical protein
MRRMGIEAIYPKRRTTWPGAGHQIYPYLLRDVEVTRPDQVWARRSHLACIHLQLKCLEVKALCC